MNKKTLLEYSYSKAIASLSEDKVTNTVTPPGIGLASRVVVTPLGLATASPCSLVFAHGSGVRFPGGHAAGHVLVVTQQKHQLSGWCFCW